MIGLQLPPSVASGSYISGYVQETDWFFHNHTDWPRLAMRCLLLYPEKVTERADKNMSVTKSCYSTLVVLPCGIFVIIS